MKKIYRIILLSIILLSLITPLISYGSIRETSPDKVDDVIPVIAPVETKMDLNSKSAILMEGSTGTIIYEKNADEKLRPASITKVMTLLLIFEALEEGKINLMDDVTVSEHAASMGGSQVYLEPYEVQNVDTMIKCISIASANDASTAMAEYIDGSEEEFVANMNRRAKELGMNNTNFVNACGLDEDNHYSSARDVAIMSRELITRFPQISNYATIWMDTIIHTTRKGQSEFGLTNTNKLVRFYEGATGLKTGSTGLAKYCLSATARKNDMDLVAVIMAAPDTKTRFAEATKLLNYGFANYSIYQDDNRELVIEPIDVLRGVLDQVSGKPEKPFSYLCSKGKSQENIRKELVMLENIEAPITNEGIIGEIIYYYDEEKIGSVNILAAEAIDQAKFKDCFIKAIRRFFLDVK
ncbi:MAG TPA: D-alanyl-D-alanine carboxypeptidase [Clostridiales bacterium]|nr:D-alanyl-D-alanine carboxypeptidase [Clostridiales bacterium]